MTRWTVSLLACGIWNKIPKGLFNVKFSLMIMQVNYGLSGCNLRNVSAPFVISSAFVTDFERHFKIGFLSSITSACWFLSPECSDNELPRAELGESVFENLLYPVSTCNTNERMKQIKRVYCFNVKEAYEPCLLKNVVVG